MFEGLKMLFSSNISVDAKSIMDIKKKIIELNDLVIATLSKAEIENKHIIIPQSLAHKHTLVLREIEDIKSCLNDLQNKYNDLEIKTTLNREALNALLRYPL